MDAALHPEVDTLNQILFVYVDVESIVKLHDCGTYFESQDALDRLTHRFQLPAADTFAQFLKSYECPTDAPLSAPTTYVTLRSFSYSNRTPLQIIVQAAAEGNLDVLDYGLKTYPELKIPEVYLKAAKAAARNNQLDILDFLNGLQPPCAKDREALFLSALKGGHLKWALSILPMGHMDLFKMGLGGRELHLAAVGKAAKSIREQKSWTSYCPRWRCPMIR